jgi:isoleucyl-tRNA synthetase
MLLCCVAVVVSFKLEDDTHTHLLAWTTTPWTLPSNLALCVNANEVYVKVKGMCRHL